LEYQHNRHKALYQCQPEQLDKALRATGPLDSGRVWAGGVCRLGVVAWTMWDAIDTVGGTGASLPPRKAPARALPDPGRIAVPMAN
jgi:hypothetical protein